MSRAARAQDLDVRSDVGDGPVPRDHTRWAGVRVEDLPALELMTPVCLGVMCFRVNPPGRVCGEDELEEINRRVLARVFWDELVFLSSTSLKGVFSLRMCMLNHTTAWEDVRRTLDRVDRRERDTRATVTSMRPPHFTGENRRARLSPSG